MYNPLSFVVVDRIPPVAASIRDTAASGTAAPLLSVTVPVTVPADDDCPMAAGEPIHNNAKRQNNAATTRLLNIQLPPGEAGLAPEATDLQNCHTRRLIGADTLGLPMESKPPTTAGDIHILIWTSIDETLALRSQAFLRIDCTPHRCAGDSDTRTSTGNWATTCHHSNLWGLYMAVSGHCQ